MERCELAGRRLLQLGFLRHQLRHGAGKFFDLAAGARPFRSTPRCLHPLHAGPFPTPRAPPLHPLLEYTDQVAHWSPTS